MRSDDEDSLSGGGKKMSQNLAKVYKINNSPKKISLFVNITGRKKKVVSWKRKFDFRRATARSYRRWKNRPNGDEAHLYLR